MSADKFLRRNAVDLTFSLGLTFFEDLKNLSKNNWYYSPREANCNGIIPK